MLLRSLKNSVDNDDSRLGRYRINAAHVIYIIFKRRLNSTVSLLTNAIIIYLLTVIRYYFSSHFFVFGFGDILHTPLVRKEASITSNIVSDSLSVVTGRITDKLSGVGKWHFFVLPLYLMTILLFIECKNQ